MEQPRSAFGTWLGVVLLFAVFALLVWVVLGIMPRGDQYEAKRVDARMTKLKTVQDEAATLHSYGWVDKEKGVARIPIERAMELTATELGQKKPMPAGPIVAPVAPAPAAAAPAIGQPAVPAVASGSPAAVPSPAANPSAPAATPSPAATIPIAGTPAPADSHSGPNSVMGGQPTGAANPRDAAPGTQPGPNATPAASAQPGAVAPAPPNDRGPTPVQSPPGTPLPVRGATPGH